MNYIKLLPTIWNFWKHNSKLLQNLEFKTVEDIHGKYVTIQRRDLIPLAEIIHLLHYLHCWHKISLLSVHRNDKLL